MARRIPSLGSQMAAAMRPILNGKIDMHSMKYIFSEDGYTNPQNVFFKPFADDKGRMVSLARGRAASCPDTENRQDVPQVRGKACVLESQCRLCHHRLPKGCCALLRARAIGSWTMPQEPK